MEDSDSDSILTKDDISRNREKYSGNERGSGNETDDSLGSENNEDLVCTSKPIDNKHEFDNNMKKKSAKAKKYDKRTCCIYCKSMVLKFPRHLIRHHKYEEKVQLIFSLPKKSEQRLQTISELRKRGNFFHNYNCFEKGEGDIVVQRRPNKNVIKNSNYLPCATCLGYYSRRTLNRHVKRCDKDSSRNMQSAGRRLLPQNPAASNILKHKILPELRDDDVGKIIKEDTLILMFGSDLAIKYCQDQHLSYHIRQRMRELGRLLLQIKEIDIEVKCLADVFQPKYCNVVLDAIKILTEFSVEDGICGKPTTIIKLRTSLTSCAELLLNQAIKNNANKEKQQINDFLSVIRFELKRLCSLANQTLEANKWNKPLELPSNSDITKFNQYLNTNINELYNKLLKEFNYDVWSQLSKIILVKIIVFNRKRVGEAQMMKINDFEMRHTVSEESDIYKTLSEVEKKISKNYFRVQVRGKHRRGVPILISKKEVEVIKEIIKFRMQAGVCEENPYVFGRKENAFIRATDAIRILSSKAGLKDSSTIRSIKLRKHIATQAQVINLKENELDDLAGSLGHDIRIHRSYYRLPEHALQVAKTGKILLAMDQGKLLENQGKSLDDIQVFTDFNEASCLSTSITEYSANECDSIIATDDSLKCKNKLSSVSASNYDDHTPTVGRYPIEITPTKNLLNKSNRISVSIRTPEPDLQASCSSVGGYSNEITPTKHKSVSIKTSEPDLQASCSGVGGYSYEITPKKQELIFKTTPHKFKRKLEYSSKECNSRDAADDNNCSSENENLFSVSTPIQEYLTPRIYPKKVKRIDKLIKNISNKSKRKSEFSSDEWDSGNDGDSSDSHENKKIFYPKQRSRWITPEKEAIKRQFSDYLLQLRVPGKVECLKAIKLEPVLKRRQWDHIKTWIHNTNKTTRARARQLKEQNK